MLSGKAVFAVYRKLRIVIGKSGVCTLSWATYSHLKKWCLQCTLGYAQSSEKVVFALYLELRTVTSKRGVCSVSWTTYSRLEKWCLQFILSYV